MDLRETRLREAVEQLTDESQSHLLGALEALYYAQGQAEAAALEPEAAQRACAACLAGAR